MRVAVLGVGLIGGSVGARRAPSGCRRRSPATTCARRRSSARSSAARSTPRSASVAEAVDGARWCSSRSRSAASRSSSARRSRRHAPDCVVTDVGSTKRAVVAAHDDPRFVGGHPLAGAENAGVEHARADLFDGATWYLTPTPVTSGVLYERLHRLLHGLGARPTAIDAETHDRILAAVSHLPHVLANVLVSQAAATLGQTATRACRRPARAFATRPGSPARRARSGPTSTCPTATR